MTLYNPNNRTYTHATVPVEATGSSITSYLDVLGYLRDKSTVRGNTTTAESSVRCDARPWAYYAICGDRTVSSTGI